METLKDGKDGFNSAAELLEDNSRSELASQFVSSHNSGVGSISCSRRWRPSTGTPWSKTSHQCSAPLFSANSVKFEQFTTG